MLSYLIAWLLVAAFVCMGIVTLVNSILLLLNSSRGPIIAKATKRFRRSIWFLIGALVGVWLIGQAVGPAFQRALLSAAGSVASTANGLQDGATAFGAGAASAGGTALSWMPGVILVVLLFIYSMWVWMKWGVRMRTQDAKVLLAIAAMAVAAPFCYLYFKLFMT